MDFLTVEIDRDLWHIECVAAVQFGFEDDVLRREADQVRQRSLAPFCLAFDAERAMRAAISSIEAAREAPRIEIQASRTHPANMMTTTAKITDAFTAAPPSTPHGGVLPRA